MCFQSLHRRAFEYGALANGLRKWDADETTDGAQPLPPTVQQLLGQPAAHFRNIFQEVSFSAAAFAELGSGAKRCGRGFGARSRLCPCTVELGLGRKNHILAVCLMEWANKSDASALSFFVTRRKRHRTSALHALRRLMSEDAVWILEGHSEEAPQSEVHLYAQAKQHVTNRLSQTFNATGLR